jgi:hypothetical protein
MGGESGTYREKRGTFRALVGKREEMISLWKPRWEDNITFVLTRGERRRRGLR